jgi:hypothetical protein
MTITGGCRCGAVRYTIEAEPLFARHCWYRDCQYIGAGSGTVNVFFASEKVSIEGALTDYTSHADSGTRTRYAARPCSRRPTRASTISASAPARSTSHISASRKSPSGPRARRAGPASILICRASLRAARRPQRACTSAVTRTGDLHRQRSLVTHMGHLAQQPRPRTLPLLSNALAGPPGLHWVSNLGEINYASLQGL